MPRRGSSKPPAEPVVKPYGCDFGYYISGIEFLADENQIGIEIMDDIVIRDNIKS
ncbi:hypothetical protein C823_004212 [Eubacterium plexicaudatum ASF492]|nr:hypothetical protein C823_004212 [Eubacterium plexicaudatum ASF492]